MRLNTLSPARGAKRAAKRAGRGIAAGRGKTCGRGQKGQHSRSGGYHKVGFEGGQMPLQRRLPKVGFRSRSARFSAEVRLHELLIPDTEVVDMDALKKANVIDRRSRKVKVIASGKLDSAVKVQGLKLTPGARAAIEAAGGSIAE